MSDQPQTERRFMAALNALEAGDIYRPWRDEILSALRMAAAVETPGLIERAIPTRDDLINAWNRGQPDENTVRADAIREAIRKGAKP